MRRGLSLPEPPAVWSAYPGGPQERAYHSLAQIVGYGGAAGGGKTDLMLGVAGTQHRKAIIFRREYEQLKGIIDRSREIFGDVGRYNTNEKAWRLDAGRKLELGAVQYEHDVNNYKGRPHDFIGIDEATEFTEYQVRFLTGWLRSTAPGQRCRVILTFNPPTTLEGEWVIRFFAPWLDETHPHPAAPGELRWYATLKSGEEVECHSGEPFEADGETIQPLSRTFFPARLADNPILAATTYGATLQSLPEPLRSQLLYGDFKAGLKPDAWQTLPTAWVKAAMDRWTPDGARAPLTCLGVDVAHGGRDKTVIAPRYGTWFDQLAAYAGTETPTGSAAAGFVLQHWARGIYANVDAIGYGASCCERLYEDHRLDAIPVNFAEGSEFKDRSGKFPCRNKRAEAYWRLREALDPEWGDNLALPPDPELLADLTAYKFKITPSGILLEDKADVAQRIKRSTDKGDAVALAMLPPAGPLALHSAAEVEIEPRARPGEPERDPWHSSRRDRITAEDHSLSRQRSWRGYGTR